MTIEEYNQAGQPLIEEALAACCGSAEWVRQMAEKRPVADWRAVHLHALDIWYEHCSRIEWIDAFRHHPRIGDLDSLRKKYAGTAAGDEQGLVQHASARTLKELLEANDAYEEKFGYIFIVCATGKSADEMLQLIKARIPNHPDDEIRVAMGEQAKITALRLAKLGGHSIREIMGRSQITTHILDTARGRPAAAVGVTLMRRSPEAWSVITEGVTDRDGRIEDLLPSGRKLAPGIYRLAFGTGDYQQAHGEQSFYPAVDIQFQLTDDSHYHVPLLLNPFGYSTYRGS